MNLTFCSLNRTFVTMKVGIIGAGAAGCFCAIELKRRMPEAEVIVFERGRKPLAKVAITGGGRCNLTNSFREIKHLQQAYPRGWRLMQRIFAQFSPQATYEWWEEAGVPLITQDDECVFPRSQDAMQVVGTLLRLMQTSGVKIMTNSRIDEVGRNYVKYNSVTESFDSIMITTGGSPRTSGLSFLAPLDLAIEQPVPSLFALNTGDEGLHALSGAVIDNAVVSIAGTKMRAEGPLLITHFGMSGPAILRLSSYAARLLAEKDYRVTLTINWMQGRNEEQVRQMFDVFANSSKQVSNQHPQHITARHWSYILQRAGIPESQRWDSLNQKERNRLIATLTSDAYPTDGRRTYKAEFVTCGGIALSNINPNTLECRQHPDIYFAGEVLDVDAITGGFNLQAAWSMGYVAAQSIADKALNKNV